MNITASTTPNHDKHPSNRPDADRDRS